MNTFSTFIILLGSHIDFLLQDRCNLVTNHFYNAEVKPYIYISGGLKFSMERHSEAYIASNFILNSSLILKDYIIIDENAKNTAENFRNFKCNIYDLLLNSSDVYSDVPSLVIATSKFHKNRAKMFFDAYFPNYPKQETWLLGEKSCSYCESDEIIHTRNIAQDIANVPPMCF